MYLMFAVAGACVLGGLVAAAVSTLEPRYRAIRSVDVQTAPAILKVAASALTELPEPSWMRAQLAVVLDDGARFPDEHEWRRARDFALRRVPRTTRAVLRLRRFHPVDNPPNDDDLRVLAEANSASAAKRLAETAARRLALNRTRRVRRVLRNARNELRLRSRLSDEPRATRLASRAEVVDAAARERISNLELLTSPDTSVAHLSPSVSRDVALGAVLGAVLGILAYALALRRRQAQTRS